MVLLAWQLNMHTWATQWKEIDMASEETKHQFLQDVVLNVRGEEHDAEEE